MRIFVTGGTGFLGSHFLQQAVARHHECFALVRSGRPHRQINGVRWIEAKMSAVPREVLENCEALVHFASAGVSPQPVTWPQAMEVNVQQSIGLIAEAAAAGVQRILLCGSCFEYGQSAERYNLIPADAPLEPIGPYAASKAAFSLAATAFARSSPASLVLLRPFNLYGEGQHSSNFWPSLKDAAINGRDFAMTMGEQVRDFQEVGRASEAFLNTLEKWPGTPGQIKIANVGSGYPISLRKFAEDWWSRWQAKGKLIFGATPYRQGEIMRYVPELR